MTKDSNVGVVDLAENFLDLDDLDLAGIEVEELENIAGGSGYSGLCSSNSGSGSGTSLTYVGCGGPY
ncbi:hypothetical protein ACFHW0_31200 [Micromonospora sp. LOL_025]|uniref:hypothetical protein n=1 Tax=Micromonospora sp. LOL_025 TaxID=3345413 RepID=UPI003A871CED